MDTILVLPSNILCRLCTYMHVHIKIHCILSQCNYFVYNTTFEVICQQTLCFLPVFFFRLSQIHINNDINDFFLNVHNNKNVIYMYTYRCCNILSSFLPVNNILQFTNYISPFFHIFVIICFIILFLFYAVYAYK